jgi:cyclopropane fatty-acyl-phospholipid synthase-like methyltransferase
MLNRKIREIAKTKLFLFPLVLFFSSFCNAVEIHDHGYWLGEDAGCLGHYYDVSLSKEIIKFFQEEQAETVVDFGCGSGEYVKALLEQHINAKGYDGNPDTPQITNGIGEIIDLSSFFDLHERFDWVLSLEVGEHIPKAFERAFIDNLHRHNTQGIILSWALPGQGGSGHFNERSNRYVKKTICNLGYLNDLETENRLRNCASLSWFKNTIMVFRKKETFY